MRMRRNGKTFAQCIPSLAVIEQARKGQEDYYRKNPNAYLIPIREYGELLSGPIIAPLAEKWPSSRV